MVGVLFLCWCANSARANVCATDIRFNGSFKSPVLLPGTSVTISYILNDTATAGVWVQVFQGTNLVQTLSSTNGNAGTNVGLNSVILNGSTNLADGAYTVSITAASAGYESWTNITDDSSNFSVFLPRGIAVNQNTNSPYYGRVYVGNAHVGTNDSPGAQVGLFKYNADGSPADEGGFSTGGYGWAGDYFSPWKMVVGADDRLYVDDFSGQGVVVSFDPTIDDTSLRQVMGVTNYPVLYTNLELSGLALTASGTNVELWMTDQYAYGSAGIIGWQLGSDGTVATNDTGTIILPVDSEFLTQAPYDLSVGSNGFIYTIQYLSNGNNAYALLSFLPYQGVPESPLYCNWAIGWYPIMEGVSGVAVDPTASFVATAVIGHGDRYNGYGRLFLFSAIDGDYITNLDQTGGKPYYDVAWDSVGNLYAVGGTTNAVWRVYSPPGTNQATTVAVPFIQVYSALQPPCLCNPAARTNGLHFTLQGQSNVTYVVQSSLDLSSWTATATNYSTNANRCVFVPASATQSFYRAVTVP
jgi:hypothetical protein